MTICQKSRKNYICLKVYQESLKSEIMPHAWVLRFKKGILVPLPWEKYP
jgi:hypothetical protein